MSAGSNPNGELKRAIKAAEARLARGERLRDADLRRLRTLAGDPTHLAPALSRRLAQIMGTHALRTRRTPPPRWTASTKTCGRPPATSASAAPG